MATLRKAVIPTSFQPRMLPATKVVPPDLLPIAGVPAIERLVDAAHRVGLFDVLLIGDANSRLIEDHFDRDRVLEARLSDRDDWAGLAAIHSASHCVIHSMRRTRPLGIGDAVALARDHVGDEPFVVMLPGRALQDESGSLRSLIEAHARDGRSATLVGGDAVRPLPRPLRLERLGRFVLAAEIFEALEHAPAQEHGERDLGHALAYLERRGRVATVPLLGESFELSDPFQRFRADLAFFLAHEPAAHRVSAIVEEVFGRVLAVA